MTELFTVHCKEEAKQAQCFSVVHNDSFVIHNASSVWQSPLLSY